MAVLSAALPICVFAPGFFLVRKFHWSPLEKLCASIGVSLVLLYLFEWGLYCVGADTGTQRTAATGMTGVAFFLGLLARHDIVRLFSAPRVRQAALGTVFLAVVTLLLLSMIRSYSGGTWFGDWLEHFQRSLFLVNGFSPDTPVFGGYIFPARPPMMNAIAAFFLAQFGDRFVAFQLVFASLNLLLFLPCCLIMPALVGPRKINVVILVALFALSPVIMQNATYTWTKALAAFYVVLGLALYLAGWRKANAARSIAAFVSLSAGVLVHYSAGPYLLFAALHYLLVVWPGQQRRLGELVAIAGAGTLLLFTWFGWSIHAYGARETFASNTSVTSARRYPGNNIVKVGANLLDTLVPVALRDPTAIESFDQPNGWGEVRDIAFAQYQNNVILGMGIVGGPIVLSLLWGALRGGAGDEPRFWMVLIPFSVLIGVAVVGERDTLGVAHLTLLPMEALGLSFLAASFPLRRSLALAVMCGCAIDFSFGVFLQARVEHLDEFGGPIVVEGRIQDSPRRSDTLSAAAQRNSFRKHQFAISNHVTQQLPSQSDDRSAKEFRALQDEDAMLWHGWFSQHGGSVEFLGDATDSMEAQSFLLLVLAVALEWKLWRTGSRLFVTPSR